MTTVDNLNPLVRFYNRRDQEKGFVVGTGPTTATSGGGTFNLHLANPTDSGVNLEVESFIIDTQFRGQYTIYDSFDTDPSGGTTLTIDNLRMDSANSVPDSGIAEANQDVTYTPATDGTHFAGVLPSGGGEGSGIGTMGGHAAGTEPIIEPGREIVIMVQNDSTNDRSGSVGIVYTEGEA